MLSLTEKIQFCFRQDLDPVYFQKRDPASRNHPCLDHPDRALDAILIAAPRCSRARCRPGPNSPAPARAAGTQVGGPGPDTPCPYHNSRRSRIRIRKRDPDPKNLITSCKLNVTAYGK
jgi:hypothetical protein